MKKLHLIILLSVAAFSANAQTFFVTGYDTYSVRKVTEKVKFEGYQVVDSAKADYIVNILVDGTFKLVSLTNTHHGYIMISDRETGKTVAKTDKKSASPSAFNGYNASYSLVSKLDKKELPKALKECPAKVAEVVVK